MVQFWYFFLPRGGGEFSFGNDFTGPRGHNHGICSGFGQRYIALDEIFHSILFHYTKLKNLYVFTAAEKQDKYRNKIEF